MPLKKSAEKRAAKNQRSANAQSQTRDRVSLAQTQIIFTARPPRRYSERCNSYDRFCPSDCLTVCLTVCHTLLSCQNDSSYDFAVFSQSLVEDSPMTIVSSRLPVTSPQNSKGNMGIGERGPRI